MREKKILVDEKEFIVKELLAIQEDEILDVDYVKKSDRVKEYIKKSTGLSEEEYSKLLARERKEIVIAMNSLNSEDFH